MTDSFDVVICTPRWLADNFHHPALSRWERYESANLLYGRQLLLMQRWDPEELRLSIEAICSDTVGPSWGVVGNRVGQWLPWEFQYRYDEDSGLDEVSDPPGTWSRARGADPLGGEPEMPGD